MRAGGSLPWVDRVYRGRCFRTLYQFAKKGPEQIEPKSAILLGGALCVYAVCAVRMLCMLYAGQGLHGWVAELCSGSASAPHLKMRLRYLGSS